MHEQESLSLPSERSEAMSKRSPEDRIRELELENQRLSKALEMERLRSKSYDTMINVAEETFFFKAPFLAMAMLKQVWHGSFGLTKRFNIPIRKKSGTKR